MRRAIVWILLLFAASTASAAPPRIRGAFIQINTSVSDWKRVIERMAALRMDTVIVQYTRIGGQQRTADLKAIVTHAHDKGMRVYAGLDDGNWSPDWENDCDLSIWSDRNRKAITAIKDQNFDAWYVPQEPGNFAQPNIKELAELFDETIAAIRTNDKKKRPIAFSMYFNPVASGLLDAAAYAKAYTVIVKKFDELFLQDGVGERQVAAIDVAAKVKPFYDKFKPVAKKLWADIEVFTFVRETGDPCTARLPADDARRLKEQVDAARGLDAVAFEMLYYIDDGCPIACDKARCAKQKNVFAAIDALNQ